MEPAVPPDARRERLETRHPIWRGGRTTMGTAACGTLDDLAPMMDEAPAHDDISAALRSLTDGGVATAAAAVPPTIFDGLDWELDVVVVLPPAEADGPAGPGWVAADLSSPLVS